ncbi:hypothetical protein E1218_18740 [Kribbella turkmenica]|uniref:Uncharacterized protein n=1 Tax=Kribbella turkmenica TaxID=2530375 RepID=A0A4R4WYM5_9ACTN|nr:hypothetical protein [Kribbella turkmenica]TDD22802.1 hypothetical protein E1218_18740 [Kribbella turkmenica]
MGARDDAVIWDAVVEQAYNEAKGVWVYCAVLTLATMIAAIAVMLGVDLAGTTAAGMVTLLLQRGVWWMYLRVKDRRAGARVEA